LGGVLEIYFLIVSNNSVINLYSHELFYFYDITADYRISFKIQHLSETIRPVASLGDNQLK